MAFDITKLTGGLKGTEAVPTVEHTNNATNTENGSTGLTGGVERHMEDDTAFKVGYEYLEHTSNTNYYRKGGMGFPVEIQMHQVIIKTPVPIVYKDFALKDVYKCGELFEKEHKLYSLEQVYEQLKISCTDSDLEGFFICLETGNYIGAITNLMVIPNMVRQIPLTLYQNREFKANVVLTRDITTYPNCDTWCLRYMLSAFPEKY